MESKASDFKFGTHGTVDIAPCKARTKLEKAVGGLNRLPDVKLYIENVKLYIEAEFCGVSSGFDGEGQEFCITMHSVKVVVDGETSE